MTEKLGKELMDEIAESVNIDEFYRRNPHEEDRNFFSNLVQAQRKERALIQIKKEKKKTKKQGLVEPEGDDDEN